MSLTLAQLSNMRPQFVSIVPDALCESTASYSWRTRARVPVNYYSSDTAVISTYLPLRARNSLCRRCNPWMVYHRSHLVTTFSPGRPQLKARLARYDGSLKVGGMIPSRPLDRFASCEHFDALLCGVVGGILAGLRRTYLRTLHRVSRKLPLQCTDSEVYNALLSPKC